MENSCLQGEIKASKVELRTWNREVFSFVDLNIEKIVEEINSLDEVAASSDVRDNSRRKELTGQFWQQLHFKESLLRQKSRSKWILEGDSNTRYFHACLGDRRRRNQLLALQVGNSWVEGVEEIKAEVKNYFERLFSDVDYSIPELDGVSFPNISAEDNDFFTAPFSLEEIKDAVWNCDGEKSPGPDGFNLQFYKKFWHLLKFEVRDFLLEFYNNTSFPKAMTATFIALIPKKDHP